MFNCIIYYYLIRLGQEHDKDKDILKVISSPIDPEEASKILSKYIEEVIAQGLENLKDNGGDLQGQVKLVNITQFLLNI